MRLLTLATAICVAVPAAAQDSPMSMVAEALTGLWSRMPSKPGMAFGAEDIAAGLRSCGVATVRYMPVEKRLVRLEVNRTPTAVFDAKRGASKQGFDLWLLAETSGTRAVLLGTIGSGNRKASIMVADEGSYVRCPKATAGEEPKP